MSDTAGFTKIETAWGETMIWDRTLTDEEIASFKRYLAERVESPAQQQYREAVESLKQIPDWRLAEIRRELNIPEPATPKGNTR